jgi:hypothetical protein
VKANRALVAGIMRLPVNTQGASVSDLHNDLESARRLANSAREVDVVVGAGDFCNAHQRLSSCVDVFRPPANS